MKVILFGATGMVGQGVLRECLRDADIASVLAIGRSTTGQRHQKLTDLAVPDLLQLSGLRAELATVDACFYCLGVSAVGMAEVDYRRVFRQDRVDLFETPTPAYNDVSASLQYLLGTGPVQWSVFLKGNNLTNAEERNHVATCMAPRSACSAWGTSARPSPGAAHSAFA